MKGNGSEFPTERPADALAADDDGLVGRREMPADVLQETVDPALLPEWNRLATFLTLFEQAWPRFNPDADRATEPASEAKAPEAASPDMHKAGQFGRFRILRTLGQGAFGIVFLAWDPALRRRVALKVPQPETLVTPQARKRFLREAYAAAGLDHPNIIPVYEIGSVGPVAYISAAYCPGPTLAGWQVRRSRPVPVRDAAELAATLARAVEHAHRRGVLHRDLKPSNILLQGPVEDGSAQADNDSLSDFQPRITDFSLAWIADGEGPKTLSGVPFGSPPYMAPEQAEGRLQAIGPPTDVYALGCILYELLAGRPPFRGAGQVEILKRVIAEDPRPLRRARRDIPRELEAIVRRCLEKQPDRRYPSALDLADDLDRFLSGKPTHARPPGRCEKLARAAKRNPAALAILLFGILFAGTLLGGRHWFENRLSESRQAARRLEDKLRDHQSAARRARYVADIRQAPGYIRGYQTRNAHDALLRHVPGPGEEDLREFAWYHLWMRCHTAHRTLRGHQGDVYYVEFSPCGNLLASAGQDGNVQIWDTTDWRRLRTIPASSTEVNASAFSPDGKSLATVDDEGKLKLWEIATGHCQLERIAHTGDAVIVRFSPDGNTLITGGRDDGFIKLWDRPSGRMVHSFRASDYNLENALLAPDGSTLACVGGHTIKLWKLSDRKLIAALPASGAIQGAAFSHDGLKLATAAESGSLIQLREVSSGRLLRDFGGHTDGVFSVAFSADDRTIISASDDQTIRIWDVATGKERGVWLGHTARVWNIAVSPDGRSIASASQDGTIKLWDLEPPGYRFEPPISRPLDLGFTPNGRTLLTFELGPPYCIARWDVRSGVPLERTPLDLSGAPASIRFSPDGRLLAFANAHAAITVYDLATGHCETLDDPLSSPVQSFEFSFDNRYLLALTAQGHLLWDLASRRRIASPWATVRWESFTPSGDLICDLDHGNVGWWELRTGRSKTIPLTPKRAIAFPVLSFNSALLATVSPYGRRISLWSADTLELRKEMPGHCIGVGPLAFSPDGHTLASAGGDGTVKLWDIATGEELITLDGYRGSVSMLRFSPDGKALATISSRGPDKPSEIILWRAAEDDAGMAEKPDRTRRP